MSNIKTQFELEVNLSHQCPGGSTGNGKVTIIGKEPISKPYLSLTICNDKHTLADAWIKDKDLERFAVNILKALKSKHLHTQKG